MTKAFVPVYVEKIPCVAFDGMSCVQKRPVVCHWLEASLPLQKSLLPQK